MFLILDFSKAMNDSTDMKPTRLSVTLRAVEAFIREFFDQNPIAHLGVIAMRDSVAEKLTELGGESTLPLLVRWYLTTTPKAIRINTSRR